MNSFLTYDSLAFLKINSLQGNPWIDRFFQGITFLGDFPVLLPFLLLFFLILYGRKGIRALLSSLPLGILIVGINYLSKFVFQRPRPIFALGNQVQLTDLQYPLSPSFPSGHAFAAFMVLGWWIAADKRLALLWLPIAGLVGFSRIYLGVHFPGDVMGGALFGLASGYLLSRFMKIQLR